MHRSPRVARDQGELIVALRTAFELHDAGVEMTRLRLRRKHPEASDEAIEEMVADWLAERPGAELGDGVGRPVPWPRPAQ